MAILKVKQLIDKLKKMPLNAEVYWADHDQDEMEVNSSVGKVELITFDKNHKDNLFQLSGEKVVLRG